MPRTKWVWSHLFRLRIFTDDIDMGFGINNCATLDLKKGKVTNFDVILLPDERVMKRLFES